MFPAEHLNLSSEMEKNLFETAIFYFDASALLDLYFFTEKTLEEIFDTLLSKFPGRFFITDQNWFEYNKNKNIVISKPKGTYQSLITSTDNKNKNDGAHLEKISKSLNELKEKGFEAINKQAEQILIKTKKDKRHPYLETQIREEFEKQINDSLIKFQSVIQSITEDYQKVQTTLKKEITNQVEKIEERESDDKLPILLSKQFEITNLDYKFSKLLEIVKEGEIRYRNKIPPGFEDKGQKDGIQIYGDLISWKQLLEHASTHNLPAILVSNDLKEDWVDEKDRPSLDLQKEFYDVSQQQFWIFGLSTFIHKLELYSKDPLKESAKEEVRALELATKEKQTSFPSELLEVIDDYLTTAYRYTEFEKLNETKNTLLYKFNTMDGDVRYSHFECATKSNYTSIINSMRKALEYIDTFEIDDDKFSLIHIALGKNQAYQIIKKHLTRSRAKEIFNENSKSLNLHLAWIEDGNLEIIDTNLFSRVIEDVPHWTGIEFQQCPNCRNYDTNSDGLCYICGYSL